MLQQLVRHTRELGRGVLQLLFPRICWVCRELQAADEPAICRACAGALTNDPHETCPRCSSTVGPHINLSQGCPSCRDEVFAFDQVFRLAPYGGVLQEVILRMKHPAGEGLAEMVGALWAQTIGPRLQPFGPGVVVPVPLHWRRYWRRGFNQSEVLARCLARHLGVPCRPRLLRRVRFTPAQSALESRQARQENVRGAFVLRRRTDLPAATIVLVDDVLTTGATAHEAARQLRLLKPARVIVAVLGHGRAGTTAGKL